MAPSPTSTSLSLKLTSHTNRLLDLGHHSPEPREILRLPWWRWARDALGKGASCIRLVQMLCNGLAFVHLLAASVVTHSCCHIARKVPWVQLLCWVGQRPVLCTWTQGLRLEPQVRSPTCPSTQATAPRLVSPFPLQSRIHSRGQRIRQEELPRECYCACVATD